MIAIRIVKTVKTTVIQKAINAKGVTDGLIACISSNGISPIMVMVMVMVMVRVRVRVSLHIIQRYMT